MTLENAIKHFHFKLSNTWKPTEKDVQAFDTLRDLVNDNYGKQTQDHALFAKLYIFVFSYFLDRYKTTVFDPIPQKEVHKLLDAPLWTIIRRFTQKLNESELYVLMDEVGANKHPVTMTEEESKRVANNLLEAIKDKNKKVQFAQKVWNAEDVGKRLEIQINEAIYRYKNKC